MEFSEGISFIRLIIVLNESEAAVSFEYSSSGNTRSEPRIGRNSPGAFSSKACSSIGEFRIASISSPVNVGLYF